MKVWIDKQGGNHYHRANCLMVNGDPHYHYEPIEHQLRTFKVNEFKIFKPITIDKKQYFPCPGCFDKVELNGTTSKS